MQDPHVSPLGNIDQKDIVSRSSFTTLSQYSRNICSSVRVMERATGGTPVGVDDPYAHVHRCDHVTDEGTCRAAILRSHGNPPFWDTLDAREFRCPVVDDESTWKSCPYFRSTTDLTTCRRCGLAERPDHHSSTARPLLEEHHLAYADGQGELNHEITVALCRWCHAKVHRSWARVTDDVSPDPEAIATREQRIARELDECAFATAASRRNQHRD